HKMIKLLVTCAGLLLACIFICLLHLQKVVSMYRQLTYDAIYTQTDMGAEIIGKTFQRDCNIIYSEAQEISRKGVRSSEEIVDMLSSMSRKVSFEKIYFINAAGMAYYPEGEVFQADEDALTEHVDMSKDVSIYLDKKYFSDGIYTFSVVSPVVEDGITQGYLVGVDQTDTLLDGVKTAYYTTQISECYVMDNDGLIIAAMQTKTDQMSIGSNFYTELQKQISDETEAEQFESSLRQGLASGELGNINVELNKDDMHLFYTSISEADGWNLVYCISQNAIRKQVWPITLEVLCTCAGILFVMILLGEVVWKYVGEDQKQIEKLAYKDMLTEAPNETSFKIRVKELLEEYHELPYVIICYDILNFRYINEGYGHAKADMVLKAMVEASWESFSYNETFARLSADMFICLSVNDGRYKERRKFLEERLSKAAGSIYMHYPVKIKCGFYAVTDYREDISDMIDKANLARKAVDINSRDLEAEYVESLMEDTRKREYIESKMESALENGEFVPYLQPKWDMKLNRISGAEALVRWRKPDGEIIPPNEFIPIFEKNGFIEKIDFYMLEKVCKYLRKMLDEGKVVYPVSINQSRYLLHDPEYTLHIQEILLKYKIPKGLVELELTETVFFQERERMLEVMKQLKELNMDLSIDDFGSGYSSLNLLRDIPFDVLKIDRGFLDKTKTSDTGKWILRKIVEMAEGLGVKVICEGVETQEQVAMLLEIGCIYVQGFLYSRPIPLEEFITKYNVEQKDECRKLSEGT
ncbi:MAG TPA: EAL domain-containing protein, partial [Lachnospiraceae bacterium]|nr:EAL domain-containing protein [Lachnospiraceae bacterium]